MEGCISRRAGPRARRAQREAAIEPGVQKHRIHTYLHVREQAKATDLRRIRLGIRDGIRRRPCIAGTGLSAQA